MNRFVSVSLEGNEVRIVHIQKHGKRATIRKTEIVPNTELEDYLKREKETEFVVVCDFRESFHDVISIPLLKPKYQKKSRIQSV